ncbi:hypothetical protein [Caldicellulosiruptor sp. DIB 104C]|uniref:SLAC1 family transporter n=1 Tax=Caldicellulosiruptor sp. DIB 104C TaxID=3019889 RepID=UPI00230646BE|nr:hypothetical protein [Caldicellulosiruptor sp. DIB 104C]
MPPVENFVVTILGNEIINKTELSHAQANQSTLIVFVNLAGFGIGFMLFLTYLSIIKGRFLLQGSIEKGCFPTIFILFALVGVSIVAQKVWHRA